MQTMSRGSLEAAPHIRRRRSTRSIMLEVSGALLPAGLAGVYRFGLRAALVILISVFFRRGGGILLCPLGQKTPERGGHERRGHGASSGI